MKIRNLLGILLVVQVGIAQDSKEDLPYYEIPNYPETYTAATVTARMIDGLGFRYYWATEGLTEEDLAFKPSQDGRTTDETVDHIYGLTKVILNAALNKPNEPTKEEEMSFEHKRAMTLRMLHQAADIFRNTEDLTDYTIVFNRENNSSEFPFWNMINGPIADAIWHCGQVVSHRRSSGNPFNSKASVFTGKVRD